MLRRCAGRMFTTVAAKPPRLEGVVVGEILKLSSHPQAERLNICEVAIAANAESVQIICGAPNVRQGMKVPVATIGTKLTLRMPNPEDAASTVEKVKIKKSKLRGELSQGMICSEEEMGLANKSDGIMELAPDSVVGTPIAAYLDAQQEHK
ncbi:Aste57867_15285 [Aphanomyces stellatus]|uniref:Aste57867_15285 protein n=1 Tax=Aphanomyces stellatus TaxID=120398 RepID=A0A485L2T3_9STRA|nr:hypothetical protein As57867_015229 [Aphanomyces stellatus]VFT92094.1 Aste57867_15285 [Aphanomyces stellatus]